MSQTWGLCLSGQMGLPCVCVYCKADQSPCQGVDPLVLLIIRCYRPDESGRGSGGESARLLPTPRDDPGLPLTSGPQ